MELPEQAVGLLLDWFQLNKRTLPWRENRTPYRVWVAEIMLQQTRVEAVKDYYLKFMERFPTVEALALAEEDEVLKAWEGLGYYSRARNLLKAARQITEGGFPNTYEGIRALQGVGDYTAGAIASIAFSLPCPAVDGNVLRVMTRYFADDSNIDEPKTKATFTEVLRRAYPKAAGDFCEALMELGALVCVPNGEPQCGACPWSSLCKAHHARMEEHFPVRKEKPARRVVPATVCVLEKDGRYALVRRESKGLLANMWQFPFFEGEVNIEQFGRVIKRKKAKHIFTHVEWHMTGYLVKADECLKEYEWASAKEIQEKYALPSAFKAFTQWIK